MKNLRKFTVAASLSLALAPALHTIDFTGNTTPVLTATSTWSNEGTAKKVVTGTPNRANSTYIEVYEQAQVTADGQTRTIRSDYKKGTYDSKGHTTTWENWDYDSNGVWTSKTVTSYKWNPITKKEVVSRVTKSENGKGVVSNKVTPTTWTTKTRTIKTGQSKKKNSTYTAETVKEQVSNFGAKKSIRTDYVKGTYDSKGHTKTWENWDYNSKGKFTSKKVTKYAYVNKKERAINNESVSFKTPGNSKSGVKTSYKNTAYFSNGKVKSTSTYTYFKNSNTSSKNSFVEYQTNGKRKYAKDTYYHTNGKVKEISSNSYNSKGTKTKHYSKKMTSTGKKTYEKTTDYTKPKLPKSFNGLKTINPSPCDTSGKRQANVSASVGYGSRQYYSRTNSKSQLVEVYAKDIILQNDRKEKVKSSGRYCNDEAKVKGTEKSNLDEGHAIADSLGGESNAYNITPQESKLNRSGQQYKMENEIRNYERQGKQVTDFHMTIAYPNSSTQIPKSYKVSYKVNGKTKTVSFANKYTQTSSAKKSTTSSTKKKAPVYANCTEVRKAGAAPIYKGQPGWLDKFDRDKDGKACE